MPGLQPLEVLQEALERGGPPLLLVELQPHGEAAHAVLLRVRVRVRVRARARARARVRVRVRVSLALTNPSPSPNPDLVDRVRRLCAHARARPARRVCEQLLDGVRVRVRAC